MNSQELDIKLEDLVYDRVATMAKPMVAMHGVDFETNVARAVDLSNFNGREVYEAVCRLVESGRLCREDVTHYKEEYGTLAEPRETSYPVAEFTAIPA